MATKLLIGQMELVVLRFRNCYIERITSYDDTTDPMGVSRCLEYENCVFGDYLA